MCHAKCVLNKFGYLFLVNLSVVGLMYKALAGGSETLEKKNLTLFSSSALIILYVCVCTEQAGDEVGVEGWCVDSSWTNIVII